MEQAEADEARLRTDPECGTIGFRRRIAAGVAVLAAVALGYWGVSEAGLVPDLNDSEHLKAQVDAWGLWGPLVVILLMAAAIVFSPIPSGPIAVVAGAAYGPFLGTLLVVAGAVLGAVGAFWIARCVGYETLRCWPAARRMLHKLDDGRSQSRLMAIVFFSRLVPFVSFDAVSYVAGLTPLTFWRFALATFAGVVPVSFALAFFGDQVTAANFETAMLLLLLAGGLMGIPFGVRALLKRRGGQRLAPPEELTEDAKPATDAQPAAVADPKPKRPHSST